MQLEIIQYITKQMPNNMCISKYFDINKLYCNCLHDGAGGSTVTLQQEGFGFDPDLPIFLIL